MPRYVAKSSITHGQGQGESRQIWNLTKGQTFDPSEMDMTKDQVDRLLGMKKVVLHDGGPASVARPLKAAVAAKTGK